MTSKTFREWVALIGTLLWVAFTVFVAVERIDDYFVGDKSALADLWLVFSGLLLVAATLMEDK